MDSSIMDPCLTGYELRAMSCELESDETVFAVEVRSAQHVAPRNFECRQAAAYAKSINHDSWMHKKFPHSSTTSRVTRSVLPSARNSKTNSHRPAMWNMNPSAT